MIKKMQTNAKGMTKTQGLRREVVRKFRQVGFWGLAKHVFLKLAHGVRRPFLHNKSRPDPFDSTYGTDTEGIIGVGSLDIPEEDMTHSMHYGPIGEEEFIATMKEFPTACEELVFVDIGSGKGRALLLASLYPFKKVMGVELSAMLHETALTNIKIFKDKRQKCRDIQSLCENGASFAIPQDPLLIFLCNPFDDQVMRVVLAHVRDSLKKFPRKMYIWYVKPCYREVLDTADFLEIVKDTGRYVFYEGRPVFD